MTEYDTITTLVTETKLHCYKNLTSIPYIAASSRPPNVEANHPTKHGVALLGSRELFENGHRDEVIVQSTDTEGHYLVWTLGDAQFIGLYLPPSFDDESFDEAVRIIRKAMSEANKRPKTSRFILGDLNIRMETGTTTINSRFHRQLVEELNAFGFHRVPMVSGRFTFFNSRSLDVTSILDHAFANEAGFRLNPRVRSLDALHELAHGSDHCYMILSIEQQLAPAVDNAEYWGYNTSKLHDPKEFKKMYDKYIELTMTDDDLTRVLDASHGNRYEEPPDVIPYEWRPEVLDPQAYIDKLEQVILGPVVQAAELTIGKNMRKGRRIPPIQESATLKRLREEKRAIVNQLKSFRQPGRLLEEAVELNHAIEHEMTFLRNKGVFKFYSSMNAYKAPELAKVIRSMHACRTKKVASLPSEPSDMTEYAAFFKAQYTSPDGNGERVELAEDTVLNERNPPIIFDFEVEQWIKWMTRGKAPGRSKVSVDLLKACQPEVATALALLYNECTRLRIAPTSWKRAMLVPIPKKANPNGISEHRPISLTEHTRKIFEHLIHHHVTDAVEPLNADQCGFRRERSTLDQCATLNEAMMQFKRRTKRDLLICFLDIKAAYDSVDRRILWRKCLEKGVPTWTVEMLMQLFDHCQSNVVIKNKESDAFVHAAGLMQGSVISPTLYSIFVNDLADAVDAAATFEIDGRRTGGLFYADDIALMAESEEQMKVLLQVCERYSIANNFRFNPKKCETFSAEGTFQLYGQDMPHTDVFKYLGIFFEKTGINWTMHVSKMVDKALAAAGFFNPVGNNGYGMPERPKLVIYKCFIRSRMEYGMAIMPHQKKLLNMWDKAQNKILRGMSSIGPSSNATPLRVLNHLPDAQGRYDELTARYACALVHKSGDEFLVDRAFAEAKRFAYNRSSFKYILENKNRLLNLLKEQGMYGRVSWRKSYKPIRNAFLMEHLTKELDTDVYHKAAIKLYPDCRPRQIYDFGRQERSVRRKIVLYMTARLMGRPQMCALCGMHMATDAHIFECTGEESAINALILGRFYPIAAERIMSSIRRCAPDKAAFYDRIIDYG